MSVELGQRRTVCTMLSNLRISPDTRKRAVRKEVGGYVVCSTRANFSLAYLLVVGMSRSLGSGNRTVAIGTSHASALTDLCLTMFSSWLGYNQDSIHLLHIAHFVSGFGSGNTYGC
jgi:hypothetical protein